MLSKSLSSLLTVSLVFASAAQASGIQSGSAHRRAHKLLKRGPSPAPADKEGTVGAENPPPAADGGQVVPYTTTYDGLDIFHQTPLVGYTTIYPSASHTSAASSSTTSSVSGGTLGPDSLGPSHSTASTTGSAPTGSLSSAISANSSTVASSSSVKASSSKATSITKSSTSVASLSTEVTTVTRLAVVGAPAETGQSDDAPPPVGAASLSAGARNVLISLGAVVVAIVGLYFVVRKTKFGKSRDRMSPEDWQPPTMQEQDRNFDPSQVRRQSAASSFHSGGGARDDMFAISDHGHGHHSTYPERDFVSGNGASAPIGVYADLARGESPTQSVYEQQYIPSSTSYPQQVGAYDYRADGHHY